ncbi:MAG: hypothetical protein NT031_07930, partial [Planctomycetota bacterium]|nr:hypothetical protein [Planctomycetota bacterium]
LTGTVNSHSAAVSVTVGGQTWLATNNGDGTWAMPAGTIAPALTTGLYDVQALASDAYGNLAADATTDELIVHILDGDVNLDGQVGLLDYNIVKANFGMVGGGYLLGDINGDGEVGLLDFNIIKANFGLTA